MTSPLPPPHAPPPQTHPAQPPTPAAASSLDVRVPEPAPEERARTRALRLRLGHALALASVVFAGALAMLPSHVFPHVPALLWFLTNLCVSLALCAPVIGALRTGRASRVAFALGVLPGGAMVFMSGVAFASGVSWLGEAIGLRAHELGWAGGLLLTSLALGTLGLVAHTAMGAGALLSFVVLCMGVVGLVEVGRPRAHERLRADDAHELAVYPGGVETPLSLGTSCGAFAVEHVGLAALVRRPVVTCDTGTEWLEPCAAQIAGAVVKDGGYRVTLTDGAVVDVAADGSSVMCEATNRSCHLSCAAAGDLLGEYGPLEVRPAAQ